MGVGRPVTYVCSSETPVSLSARPLEACSDSSSYFSFVQCSHLQCSYNLPSSSPCLYGCTVGLDTKRVVFPVLEGKGVVKTRSMCLVVPSPWLSVVFVNQTHKVGEWHALEQLPVRDRENVKSSKCYYRLLPPYLWLIFSCYPVLPYPSSVTL